MCTPCHSYYMASLFTPNSTTMMHVFCLLKLNTCFSVQVNKKLNNAYYHWFNKLIYYTGQLYLWTRLYNNEPCNMLHIKCQVFECRPSEVIRVVLCVAS